MSSGFTALVQIGRVGEAREPLDEPQWVAAFLAGVLEDACHTSGAHRIDKLRAFALVCRPARHGHLLAQIGQFRLAGARLNGGGEPRAIQRRAWRKAVALEDE
jgi:hypothetical protein